MRAPDRDEGHDHDGITDRAKGVLGTVDRWQQQHRAAAFPVAVVKKFGDDRAGRLAALVAYYGFFSLFPLLLVAATIIGFVTDEKDARELQDSALAQIPVVGEQVGSQVGGGLHGSGIALVIGLVAALWAGLGCMQAAQDGVNDVWDVPRAEQPSFFRKRLRSLLTLGVIGGSLVIGAAASQAVALLPDLGPATRLLAWLVTVAINVLVFWLAFVVLTDPAVGWRRLLPGAVVAGIGYSLLQVLGRWYIDRTVTGASDTYGTFAAVIGLLTWLYLLGQLLLLASEVNVVAARRLWPRSLFGPTAGSVW